MSKIPETEPERSLYFAELAAKRWSKPRPMPKIRRGARAFPGGSDQERFWDERARQLGLSSEGMNRAAWRRLLLRLADADTVRLAAAAAEPSATGDSDTDLLLTYLEQEAARLRDRARRDRQVADLHDREAAEAESRLIAEMRSRGLSS